VRANIFISRCRLWYSGLDSGFFAPLVGNEEGDEREAHDSAWGERREKLPVCICGHSSRLNNNYHVFVWSETIAEYLR